MDKIRVAIAGVGNCASSLIQGLHYYRERGGPDLEAVSAYFMKSPPLQMRDSVARERTNAFIQDRQDRQDGKAEAAESGGREKAATGE